MGVAEEEIAIVGRLICWRWRAWSQPAPIRIFRKCEAAHEASIGAFNPMMFFPFFFLLKCPFSENRQDIVLHRKSHVRFPHARQFGLDEVCARSSIVDAMGYSLMPMVPWVLPAK